MVKGTLYTTGGTRRSVISLDGRTGELNWAHSLREGRRAAVSPRQLSGRGVSYWTDGKGDERVIYVTTGYQLVELDAKTGAMIQSFANKGVLDLKVGVVKGVNQQIDLESGEIGIHSTPAVVGDIVIIGSSFREGATVSTHNNTKGLVRAFDVRTGKQSGVQHDSEPGRVRPRDVGQRFVGDQRQRGRVDADQRRRGARPRLSARRDADIGSLRRPPSRQQPLCRKSRVRRPEDRQAEVAFPVRASPALEPRHVVGAAAGRHQRQRPRDQSGRRSEQAELSLRVRSRDGRAGVADRRAAGPARRRSREKTYSPTQPFPTKPPAYARNFVNIPDDIIDFTPELRAQALSQLSRYKPGPLFNPPILGTNDGLLGSLSIGNLGGGTNWPGGGYDPEMHVAFAPASNAGRQLAFARDAAARVLRHPVCPRSKRPAVRRSVRARRLLRGGFASRNRTGGQRRWSPGTAFDSHGCRKRGGYVEASGRRAHACRAFQS